MEEKIDKELMDLKNAVSGVGQGTMDLNNKIDAEMGTLRQQTQGELGGIRTELGNRWSLMMSTLDQHNVQIQNLNNKINNLDSMGRNGAKPWSILQDKAIHTMTKMGNDKSKWKNWLHKLKNVLGDVVKDRSWDF